jgi:hypothetical protein
VYGNDVRYGTPAGVVVSKHSATGSAVSHRNDKFRIRYGIQSAFQGLFHVRRYWPCYQQQVSVAWARYKFNTNAFEVIVRIIESLNLEFATVAGPSIDMANTDSTAQDLPKIPLESFDLR